MREQPNPAPDAESLRLLHQTLLGEALSTALDLAHCADRRVDTLSKGMSQRVQFIAAIVPGRSIPRGETEPPLMNTSGSTAFIASYARASNCTYAGAATSSPAGPNCGSQ